MCYFQKGPIYSAVRYDNILTITAFENKDINICKWNYANKHQVFPLLSVTGKNPNVSADTGAPWLKSVISIRVIPLGDE